MDQGFNNYCLEFCYWNFLFSCSKVSDANIGIIVNFGSFEKPHWLLLVLCQRNIKTTSFYPSCTKQDHSLYSVKAHIHQLQQIFQYLTVTAVTSRPNCLGHRGLLVVYVFMMFAPTSSRLSRVVPPCATSYKRGTGSRLVTRSGVFEIPVAE